MTIGIAAYGPNAGLAVLRALSAVEAVGRGAIGGFVSLAALTSTGGTVRAETQDGGSRGLFADGLDTAPPDILTAPVAGLISSGPNRPEPLSQFIPAIGGVGLVTGHRMPNTVGTSGRRINEDVLELMRKGSNAKDAVTAVLVANPRADAGVIALTAAGDIFAADAAYLAQRGDSGRMILGSRDAGAVVGVLHNSIQPFRPLAVLAAEVARDVMQPPDLVDGWITLRQGIRLVSGTSNAVHVSSSGIVESIAVEDERFLAGSWSVGLGYETAVFCQGAVVGTLLHEPYMVVGDGLVRTIDGSLERRTPIRAPRHAEAGAGARGSKAG